MGTSTVRIEGDRVIKRVTQHGKELELLTREVMALDRLRRYDWAPKVLAIDIPQREFTMSYCGGHLTRETLPPSWQAQMDAILDGLVNAGVKHNDIKPEDILLKDGRLHLIDYGWATLGGAPMPNNWPDSLGGYIRDGEDFDDREAFERSIAYIQRTT